MAVLVIEKYQMSLDIYLKQFNEIPEEACLQCLVEDADHTHEFLLFHLNVTHNLNKMAEEAGVYHAMWHPETFAATPRAYDIEPLLRQGLQSLRSYPERFTAHEPTNKWGTIDSLSNAVTRYLEACRMYPEAVVRVSR